MSDSSRRFLAGAALVLLGACAIAVPALYLLAWLAGPPRPLHPFFREPAVNYAHRGGGMNAPESTLEAFDAALGNGAHILEMDLRLTRDGHLVVMHDELVDRTTDGTGPISDMTLAEVRTLNAGHDFVDAAGAFPHRDAPVRAPTFPEVLRAHPGVRLLVEMKTEDGALPLCGAIRVARAEDRVGVGSFSTTAIRRFRAACPGVATVASFREAALFLALARLGLEELHRGDADGLSVSERSGALRVVNPGFLRAARQVGLPVVVWTVNNPADMERLLTMGVDGILTDDPRTLSGLLAGDR